MKIIIGGLIILLILLWWRRGRALVNATKDSADRQTWAIASEVRSMRFPKGRWFRSRKGLK